MTREGCLFCSSNDSPLEDVIEDKFKNYLHNYHHRYVYLSSENFISFPDQHPVGDFPYFLIVPRFHYTSFVQMPLSYNEEVKKHIIYLQACVRKKYENQFNQVIIFEHGQNADGNKVKSVYHAHLHVMFVDQDESNIRDYINHRMQALGIETQKNILTSPFNYIFSLRSVVESDQDYLYFYSGQEDIGEQITVLDNGQYDLFSQFFRVLLAEACHNEFFDWKTASTAEADIFKKRLAVLPEPID